MMTPERWQQIKALLQSALEREPNQRSAFLAEACAKDESLRKDVDSFIISHEQAGDFIEAPAFEVMADSLADNQSESLIGQALGHYTLREQLGAGFSLIDILRSRGRAGQGRNDARQGQEALEL